MTIQQRLIIERVADLPFEYIYTEKDEKNCEKYLKDTFNVFNVCNYGLIEDIYNYELNL